MSQMSQGIQDMIAPLLADKKKLSLMIILIVVAGVMWGRMLLNRSPQAARASTQAGQSLGGEATSQDALLDRPQVVVDLPDRVDRDLFAFNPAGYESLPKEETPKDDGGAKSQPKVDDKSIEVSAEGLELQSTLGGATPKAMINGELIGIGQSIRGFKVKTITPRAVVLEKNGIEVRLEM